MSAFGGKADMARKYLSIRWSLSLGPLGTTNAPDDACLRRASLDGGFVEHR
jgi:hypothetical protein